MTGKAFYIKTYFSEVLLLFNLGNCKMQKHDKQTKERRKKNPSTKPTQVNKKTVIKER